MADFSPATENIDEWDDCLELIGAVCKTIRFTHSRPPDSLATISKEDYGDGSR